MEMARILNSALLILIIAFLIREVYPHEQKRTDVKQLKYFSDGNNTNKNWHTFDSPSYRRFGHRTAWSREVGGKEDLERDRETQTPSENAKEKQQFYGGWSFQNEMKSETHGNSNNGGGKKEFHRGFSLRNVLHSIVEFVNGLSVDEKKNIIESINKNELIDSNNNSVKSEPETKSEEDDRDTVEITGENSSEEDSVKSRTPNRSDTQYNKKLDWQGMYFPKEVFQPKAKEFEFINEKPKQYDKDFEFKDITSEDLAGFGERQNFFNNREEIFDKPILWQYDDNANKYRFSRNKLNPGFQPNTGERAPFYSKAEHVKNNGKIRPKKEPRTENREQLYDASKNKNPNENFSSAPWPITVDQSSSTLPMQDKPQEWTLAGVVTKDNLSTISPTASTTREMDETIEQTSSTTPVQNKPEDETTANINTATTKANIAKNSSTENIPQEMGADVEKKILTIPIQNNPEAGTMVGVDTIRETTTNDILLPEDSPTQSTPQVIDEIRTESMPTNPENTQIDQEATELPHDYSTIIFSDVNKIGKGPNNDMFNGNEFIFFRPGEMGRKFPVMYPYQSKPNKPYILNESKKVHQNEPQVEEADRGKLPEEKKQQHNSGKYNNEENESLSTSKPQEVEDKGIPEETNNYGQQQPSNDNKEAIFDKPKKLNKAGTKFDSRNAPQINVSPPDNQETKSDGEKSSEIDNTTNNRTDTSFENNSQEDNNEENESLPTSKPQKIEDKGIPEETNKDGQQQPPNDNKGKNFDKPKKLNKVDTKFHNKNAPQTNANPPDNQETKSDGEESSEIDNTANKITDTSFENNSQETEEVKQKYQTQDDSSIETARTALTVEEDKTNVQRQSNSTEGGNDTSYQSDESECSYCSENSDEEDDADIEEEDFLTEDEAKSSTVNVSEQEETETDSVTYSKNPTQSSLPKNANESAADSYKPQEAFNTILEYLYQYSNSPLLKELKATRNKNITSN